MKRRVLKKRASRAKRELRLGLKRGTVSRRPIPRLVTVEDYERVIAERIGE